MAVSRATKAKKRSFSGEHRKKAISTLPCNPTTQMYFYNMLSLDLGVLLFGIWDLKPRFELGEIPMTSFVFIVVVRPSSKTHDPKYQTTTS